MDELEVFVDFEPDEAWARYLADTRSLRGREYDEWEPVYWARLQSVLLNR
jgi:hypothetical protein